MWAKYGVRVLGTPVASIVQSEDRKMFAEVVASVGERVAPSAAVYSVEEVRCCVCSGPFVFGVGYSGDGYLTRTLLLRVLSSCQWLGITLARVMFFLLELSGKINGRMLMVVHTHYIKQIFS